MNITSSMGGDWSELMPELLEKIAGKCMSKNLKDAVMFSCVCRSWHQAVASVQSDVMLKQQIPWLVLPNDLEISRCSKSEEADVDDKRKAFDLGNNNCYTLSLPHAAKRRLYGTGSQWILTVGLDRQIHLVNPLTRVLLPLPSYTTFAFPPCDDGDEDEDEDAQGQRHKVVSWLPNSRNLCDTIPFFPPLLEELLEDGDEDEFEDEDEDEDEFEDEDEDELTDEGGIFMILESPFDENERFRIDFVKRALVVHLNDDVLVVVIYGKYDYVAIAKPEDCRWTPINNVCFVSDVAYCPTSSLILFQQGSGHVNVCDLHQLMMNNTGSSVSAAEYAPPPASLISLGSQCHERLYLLESFGNILMVRRSYDRISMDTCKFQVFTLDLHTKEWTEVFHLGDVVLFVGNSPLTSVKASSFPASCKPNSIYFNDDGYRIYCWGSSYDGDGNLVDFVPGGRDMGVYDFAHQTTQSFYNGHDNLSKYSVPVWLMPKL